MNGGEGPAWKRHSGALATPTLALAGAVLLGLVLVPVLQLQFGMPLWAAMPAMAALQYLAFTPLHEAVHGNVSGDRSGQGPLDVLVGHLMGAALLAPYRAFQGVHLRHHARTNVPGEDPDHWVAGPWWQTILRCPSILLSYEWQLWVQRPKALAAYRRPAVWASLILYGAMAGLCLLGLQRELLLLWVLPGIVAHGLLAFAFDWLPHHPHDRQGRHVDTRVLLAPGLRWLLLSQDLHAVHHLWPRVPFYRYGAVWAEEGEGMEAKGTRVWRMGGERSRGELPSGGEECL